MVVLAVQSHKNVTQYIISLKEESCTKVLLLLCPCFDSSEAHFPSTSYRLVFVQEVCFAVYELKVFKLTPVPESSN